MAAGYARQMVLCGAGTEFVEDEPRRNGTTHSRLDGSTGAEKRWKYPDLVARRPCAMLGVNIAVIVLLVAIVAAAGYVELTENSDYDFTISSTEASNMVDAIDLAEAQSLKGNVATEVKEREQLGERNKLFLLFEAKSGGNVFTSQRLQEICKSEALFVENRQFAAGGTPPDGTAYPGTCVVRPRSNYSQPLDGTFADDCTVGPVPLITDLFFHQASNFAGCHSGNNFCGNRNFSCSHGQQEIAWDKHMDMNGALSRRSLNFDCPSGQQSQCTELPSEWVEWRHNQLICDATMPGNDDATVLKRAANLFYLPAAGAVRPACCDSGGSQLSAALSELHSCHAAVPLLVSATTAIERAALASSSGKNLSDITCTSGDLGAKLGGGIAAGTVLASLCPFACSRQPAADGGSGATCAAPTPADKTRDIVYIGWPLAGFSAEAQQGDEQQELYTNYYYDLEGGLFTYFGLDQAGSMTTSPMRSNALEGETQVRWWGFALQDLEFTRVSYQDLSFTMASILFVWVYITIHTGSVFIGGLGMLQIILTLPIALFFYRAIFQIKFFNQLHVLAIYLALGIGADDIFVFMDGWKQSINSYHNTADRLDITYKRATYAMGATSSTTCVAFIATAISPIMPIASFGVFAALTILINYLLVMTLFPCILMIWHYRSYGCLRRPCKSRCCCLCCCQQPFVPEGTRPAAANGEAAQQVTNPKSATAESDEILGRLESFFKTKYAPFIAHKPVAAGLTGFFLAYIVFSIVMGVQLEPPTEQEKWFPEDHMYQQVADIIGNEFASDAADSYIEVRLVYGLKGMDRDNTNFWTPCCLEDGNRGSVIYDDTFDLSSQASQQFFVDTCDALMATPCTLPGCEGAAPTLVQPQEVGDDSWCWVKIFMNQYPQVNRTGANFATALADFYTANPSLRASIGIVGGQLKYATITARSTLLQFQPNAKTEPVVHAFSDFRDQRAALAPPGLKSMIHSGGVFWTWTFTEAQLTTNVYKGFAICFPCAFLVLLITTRNWVVTSVAIITVVGIVASVMGFCKWAMDWGLGIAESIAAVIVIGFSVDYVVHLAHMYMSAGQRNPPIDRRSDRVAYALKTMGVTVFSGAITTFGSGLFLVFTQLTFFVKFSILIMITIFSSIVLALCFFMPALVLIGPEGDFGNINCSFLPSCKKEVVLPIEETNNNNLDKEQGKDGNQKP